MTLCIVKKTLDAIIETGNHYVVAIKKNSKKLYSLIESATARLTKCYDYHKTEEKNRGRREIRITHAFEASKEIKECIPHIKTVVRIKRLRTNKKKTSEEIIYYACDVGYNAKKFSKGIRGHWTIENNLHWVKDVVMNEDKSLMGNISIAPIISILKSHIIGLAYVNTKSVINFQRTISHDIGIMSLLLE